MRSSSSVQLAAFLFLGSQARGALVTFSDSNFNPSDWSLVVQTLNRGGTATAAQATNSSPSDTDRAITITLTSAVGSGTDSQVYAYSLFNTAVYNPATMGAITSLAFAEQRNTTGGGQEMGPALVQDGRYYYAYMDSGNSSPAWQSETKNFAVTDFRTDTGITPPNFSATGDPITFGFAAINNTGVNNSAPPTIAYYDNWQIALTTTPVPEPVGSGLALLGGIAVLGRRCRRFQGQRSR
jgi:hypothetical protein